MAVSIGFAGIAGLLLLLFLRVPIAIALIVVSFFGIGALIGWVPALGILQNTPYGFVASWTLSAVPMFLLMGFLAFHTGITTGLFEAARSILWRVPGGLALASIFACSGFAAVSGSSLACSAAMGRIAVPEMAKSGYSPGFACGAVAAGGTIGALIPPSILMIIYGIFAETSIIQVFLGGVSVGILTAIGYCLVVLAFCALRPDIVPRTVDRGESLGPIAALGAIWPTMLLVTLVFGGLFSGYFTATEAGAVGALGAVLISAGIGKLTWPALRTSLLETVLTTVALFMIGTGAAMFTRFLGITGLSGFLASWVGAADIGYFQLMLTIALIYLVLGMFMEPFGALLITLPVFLPILRDQGLSLVWYGVLVVKLLEVGMISPPVGMNVFVIQSVAGRYAGVARIFKAVMPFILADLLVISAIIAVPAIVLCLPQMILAKP